MVYWDTDQAGTDYRRGLFF